MDMKKWNAISGILLLTLFLTACGKVTEDVKPSEQEISISDEAVADSEQVKEPVAEKEPEAASDKTKVSGSFTVTVREVLPDYVLDDFTPNMAVVTEFQSSPFMMYVGEEIGRRLEAGTTYVFTIESTTLNFSMDTLEQMGMCSIVWFLDIVDVRPANEDECGLESLQIDFEEVKE